MSARWSARFSAASSGTTRSSSAAMRRRSHNRAHVVVLDERGRGLYGPPGTEDHYPAEALTGKGTVNVDATDWADVSALCALFGIIFDGEFSHARDAARTGDTPWRR